MYLNRRLFLSTGKKQSKLLQKSVRGEKKYSFEEVLV